MFGSLDRTSPYGHAGWDQFSVDCLPHLVWIADAGGNVEYLNRWGLVYLGQPMNAMLGLEWTQAVHPDDLQRSLSLWATALQTGRDFETEHRLLRHDGEYRWHLVRGQPLRGADGSVQRWFGTCTDIDDQKAAEESLLSLNVALENAVEGIAKLDATGCYLSVNPAYARTTGYNVVEMIGMQLQSTIHPEDREAVAAAYGRMRDCGCCEIEVRGIRRDCQEFYQRVVMVRARQPNGEFGGYYCFMRDVTEQRMAQQALRSSETLFRALIENSYDAVELVAADGTILYASPAIVRTGGRTQEEVVGQRVFDWSHPDDVKELESKFVTFLESPGASRRVESRYRHKDGSWRWAEATCTNLLHEPAVGAVVINVHDITERKEAERAVQASNDLLRAVTHGTTDAVFVKDSEGRYLMSNATCTEWLGGNPAAVIGRTDFDILPSDVAARFRADDLAVMALGQSKTYEELMPSPFGDRVLFTSKAPYRDASDAVAGVIGISRDITDRKRIEEDREKFVALVENAADFISLGTLDGQVLYVNHSGRRLMGLDDMPTGVGARFEEYGPPEAVVRWRNEAMPQARAVGRWEGEVQFKHFKTGKLLDVQQCIFTVKTPGGAEPLCLATVARDITERKQLEEQLRQSQKMEAVGRLAGGVAHDFNNLLTVINGYSELMLSTLGDHGELRSMLEEVHKAGERAAGLTRQLLAFSRQQILQPKLLDLNEVVTELVKMLQRVIGEDVELVLKPGASVSKIEADPGQIEQVLVNLAVNARDAMPTGGRLTIETRSETLQAGIARDGAEICAGAYVLLNVSDTGCGMSADVLAHIFEPFFTTKEQGKGTGLGLPTVYGIVQQSGGHIEVDTVVGKGTTFRVYLPAAAATCSASDEDATKRPAPRGKETILLVEDEEGVRGLTQLMLQQLGYNVLAAANAEQALTLSRRSEQKVDLLLTDVVMPGRSGRALAEQLQGESPSLRVLYMSGYTDDVFVRHGIEHVQAAFIQKPFSVDALAWKVRDVLNCSVTSSQTEQTPSTPLKPFDLGESSIYEAPLANQGLRS